MIRMGGSSVSEEWEKFSSHQTHYIRILIIFVYLLMWSSLVLYQILANLKALKHNRWWTLLWALGDKRGSIAYFTVVDVKCKECWRKKFSYEAQRGTVSSSRKNIIRRINKLKDLNEKLDGKPDDLSSDSPTLQLVSMVPSCIVWLLMMLLTTRMQIQGEIKRSR